MLCASASFGVRQLAQCFLFAELAAARIPFSSVPARISPAGRSTIDTTLRLA